MFYKEKNDFVLVVFFCFFTAINIATSCLTHLAIMPLGVKKIALIINYVLEPVTFVRSSLCV